MSISNRRDFILSSGAVVAASALASPALAASRGKIDRRVRSAINVIRTQMPQVSRLYDQSAGVLMMPRVRRAGLGFGAAYGEGSLLIGETPVDYYSVAAASFGLQFGVQQYSSALFFSDSEKLTKFRRQDGWTAGADLEFTVWDQGDTIDIDTNTGSDRIYGVVFSQEGLHLGATLEGSKYSRISR
ncbi:twin-arginine translocation pathway signal sequence domain-containing protein [Amylibacter marinus]|uniref:Twin-arginine translocation pathway signal sequence domain-containing protein n=1 Tax=Amylibacter marinus TaxID=1475483 RepID=A0ABQ5VT32_9RHOB|nr:YSC84-related protein [Amylibacter marinus]GLQ34309.1 twin-arginine translocation pathway signal sequence domain-containing protein [Amylibacter marinus]